MSAVEGGRQFYEAPEIEALLPAGALHAARIAEQSERQHLERWADLMAGARP